MLSLDLDPEVKTTITDEYSSEKAPDDGTFYYKIRKYQGVRGESNPDFERLWLARLAAAFPGKKKGFNQLLLARNQSFREKFDKLLFDIPALRGGMMLSTIHKMIGMKSHDVGEFSISWLKLANKYRNTTATLITSINGILLYLGRETCARSPELT